MQAAKADSDPVTQSPHLLCFGLGFTGMALAQRLIADGGQVTGTCRDRARALELQRLGITPVLFERTQPIADLAQRLASVTHLLSSVPPDETGDSVLDVHGAEIAEASRHLAWIGYLSTTGVYGDRGGDWVDETSTPTPSGTRGRRRLDAERAWLALPNPAHLFRLAGIYGAGRSALDTVRSGKARRILKPGQVFSRIHVEDIVAVLLASMTRPEAGTAYNVCDDDAADPAEVIAFACALLGATTPPLVPFAEAQLSPMARSFYDDNKRVRNDRIKQALGVSLRYPSYREGLRALLAAGN
jgi:nucleoside-diphosphate-sugar epimerase